MRRAVPAAIATLIGLFALLTFKSSTVSAKSAGGRLASGTPTTGAPPEPTTSAPPTSGAPRGSTPPTNGPTNPPTNAPTAPTTAGATRTFDGDPFDNQYGTVQVRVTLQGGRITNVEPLQMPQDRERSAVISQEAQPLLLQEVLQAQSAQIDIIGGATFTSQSYAQSLQSALDKSHG